MDQRLIAWGRSVKSSGPPPLWFFTDETRTPDPLPTIRRLPRGLCGVIFRHDSAPNRATLAQQAAQICRARRLTLVIAGDARLAAALHAGLHLRGGRKPSLTPHHGLTTSSVHTTADLHRARRTGAKILFCSPAFPTASHPGALSLGIFNWLRLARQAAPAIPCALGGVNGASIRRLGKICAGAGAIDAFLCTHSAEPER